VRRHSVVVRRGHRTAGFGGHSVSAAEPALRRDVRYARQVAGLRCLADRNHAALDARKLHNSRRGILQPARSSAEAHVDKKSAVWNEVHGSALPTERGHVSRD
jgi:hypothetical protein